MCNIRARGGCTSPPPRTVRQRGQVEAGGTLRAGAATLEKRDVPAAHQESSAAPAFKLSWP